MPLMSTENDSSGLNCLTVTYGAEWTVWLWIQYRGILSAEEAFRKINPPL